MVEETIFAQYKTITLKAIIKSFEASQRSVKNKNLSFILIQLSEMHRAGRDKVN